MSYDVWLTVDVGGTDPAPLGVLDANYTCNVAPMFMKAIGETPTAWSGRPASEVSGQCSRILSAFDANPFEYERLNPDNGWGDFVGARAFIQTIKDACDAAPKAIVRVG